MLIGYARVSTDDQDTAAQVAALRAAGCERMYREKASGGRWDRPELLRLMDHLRKGDVRQIACKGLRQIICKVTHSKKTHHRLRRSQGHLVTGIHVVPQSPAPLMGFLPGKY